jgi:hypothetical protein
MADGLTASPITRRRRFQAGFRPTDATTVVNMSRAIVAALKMVDTGRDDLRAES